MLLLALVALANEALAARADEEVTGFDGVIHDPFSITMRQDCASPKLYSETLGQLGSGPGESLSFNFNTINVTYTQQQT